MQKTEKHFFNIRLRKKFLQIKENFDDSKKYSLMKKNLFLWIKDFLNQQNLFLIQRQFFLNRILKKCFSVFYTEKNSF